MTKNILGRILATAASSLLMTDALPSDQPPDVVQSDNYRNTAMGTSVLISIQPSFDTDPYTGAFNTAAGWFALSGNTTGIANNAFGVSALIANSTGTENVAMGNDSLYENTTGSDNVAIGVDALYENIGGSDNTATGSFALTYNQEGESNTGVGYAALGNGASGSENTAVGADSLLNSTASYNTAAGANSLLSNTAGADNVADGVNGLYSNTNGNRNTAIGDNALFSNTTGSYNIGVGNHGGYNLTTGSNNIDIGNIGVAAESGIIRIGTAGTQTGVYIAGIESSKVTGAAVVVTASGQLGVLASSERYKTAIEPLGPRTAKLKELRPVSFHLKSDPGGVVQYGLIAEEVAKIYPELVIRDSAGEIQGVRYDELAPMLLNEEQQDKATIKAQADELKAVDARLADVSERADVMQQQLAEVMKTNQAMQAALAEIRSRDQRVAMQ